MSINTSPRPIRVFYLLISQKNIWFYVKEDSWYWIEFLWWSALGSSSETGPAIVLPASREESVVVWSTSAWVPFSKPVVVFCSCSLPKLSDRFWNVSLWNWKSLQFVVYIWLKMWPYITLFAVYSELSGTYMRRSLLILLVFSLCCASTSSCRFWSGDFVTKIVCFLLTDGLPCCCWWWWWWDICFWLFIACLVASTIRSLFCCWCCKTDSYDGFVYSTDPDEVFIGSVCMKLEATNPAALFWFGLESPSSRPKFSRFDISFSVSAGRCCRTDECFCLVW